jgi:hypothetical protein
MVRPLCKLCTGARPSRLRGHSDPGPRAVTVWLPVTSRGVPASARGQPVRRRPARRRGRRLPDSELVQRLYVF